MGVLPLCFTSASPLHIHHRTTLQQNPTTLQDFQLSEEALHTNLRILQYHHWSCTFASPTLLSDSLNSTPDTHCSVSIFLIFGFLLALLASYTWKLIYKRPHSQDLYPTTQTALVIMTRYRGRYGGGGTFGPTGMPQAQASWDSIFKSPPPTQVRHASIFSDRSDDVQWGNGSLPQPQRRARQALAPRDANAGRVQTVEELSMDLARLWNQLEGDDAIMRPGYKSRTTVSQSHYVARVGNKVIWMKPELEIDLGPGKIEKTIGSISDVDGPTLMMSYSGYKTKAPAHDKLLDNDSWTMAVYDFCRLIEHELPQNPFLDQPWLKGAFYACHVEKRLMLWYLCQQIRNPVTKRLDLKMLEELRGRIVPLKAIIRLNQDGCQCCQDFRDSFEEFSGIVFQLEVPMTLVQGVLTRGGGRRGYKRYEIPKNGYEGVNGLIQKQATAGNKYVPPRRSARRRTAKLMVVIPIKPVRREENGLHDGTDSPRRPRTTHHTEIVDLTLDSDDDEQVLTITRRPRPKRRAPKKSGSTFPPRSPNSSPRSSRSRETLDYEIFRDCDQIQLSLKKSRRTPKPVRQLPSANPIPLPPPPPPAAPRRRNPNKQSDASHFRSMLKKFNYQ